MEARQANDNEVKYHYYYYNIKCHSVEKAQTF